MNLQSLFLVPGTSILYASLVAMIAAFLITLFSLRRRGAGNEALFVGLASAASGIWLYELVYHYAYGMSFLQLYLDARRIDISGTSAGQLSVFPLAWSIIVILLPFAAYRSMSINPYFLAALAAGIALFVLWILFGFPQFSNVNWSSAWTGYREVILVPSTSRITIAFVLNSLTKVLVCVPALLFLPRKKVAGKSTRPIYGRERKEEVVGDQPVGEKKPLSKQY